MFVSIFVSSYFCIGVFIIYQYYIKTEGFSLNFRGTSCTCPEHRNRQLVQGSRGASGVGAFGASFEKLASYFLRASLTQTSRIRKNLWEICGNIYEIYGCWRWSQKSLVISPPSLIRWHICGWIYMHAKKNDHLELGRWVLHELAHLKKLLKRLGIVEKMQLKSLNWSCKKIITKSSSRMPPQMLPDQQQLQMPSQCCGL